MELTGCVYLLGPQAFHGSNLMRGLTTTIMEEVSALHGPCPVTRCHPEPKMQVPKQEAAPLPGKSFSPAGTPSRSAAELRMRMLAWCSTSQSICSLDMPASASAPSMTWRGSQQAG